VVVPDKTLGGEDMAFFLEKAPGCFFCLGAGDDAYAGIHNPRFEFNEAILLSGVETYCRAAIDLLGKPSPADRWCPSFIRPNTELSSSQGCH
jgi:amidohydrolase